MKYCFSFLLSLLLVLLSIGYTSAAEPEVISFESGALEDQELPSSFDLRNVDTDGDGVGDRCYVTPVRSQRPLGDCWAFAVTAAAETSILGSVLEDDPEAYKSLDLSEKQLAYFANTALNDPSHPQNGEGRYVVEINDAHDIYDEGDTTLPASVYAMGVGPVSESRDPGYEYRGKNGTIASETALDGTLYDFSYSVDDDWTIDESLRFRSDFLLTSAYELPCPNDSPSHEQEDPEYVYNEAGTIAIKEQLLQKHAVAIGFHSDSSKPWETGEKGEYINVETWAHYTWQRGFVTAGNHAVTIIGWDDDYPVSNFLEEHQPPANGAWLIKNSWGSGENEFPNRATGLWGLPVDPDDPSKGGSGYFWISYYDQSISLPTVYLFDYSLLGADADLDIASVVRNQHDFVPITVVSSIPCDSKAKAANVFMAEEAQNLTALSFHTEGMDIKVTWQVYLLNEEFQSPEDGELVAEGEGTYATSGIYMEKLSKQIAIEKGQMFSVVMTHQMADGTFVFPISVSGGKDSPNIKNEVLFKYAKAVVGEGESYICRDGSWVDLSAENAVALIAGDPALVEDFKKNDNQMDNFSIKVYGIVQ